MGINLGEIIPRKEVELEHLAGKKIAIDAYNQIYQFLSTIRDRMTGETLRDSKGRITSHLSGLFYRTAKLIEVGIKPVFVFDGEPPEFKKKTLEEREKMKEEAEKKWKEALEAGEEAKIYAQATAKLTDEMVEESKKLLKLMGIPVVQAPSEGEAQAAYMALKKDVYASASQDYDSLLFGSPILIRNLSIVGKRKLPRKEVYVEIKPEVIELENVLKNLGITREQLIIMGILIGTDYNPGGIKGYGPKKALELVKKAKSLENVLKVVKWEFDIDPKEILEFFLNPPVSDNYKLEWKPVKKEELIKFMVDEHDFSLERVTKVINNLEKSFRSGTQSSLAGWFKK
ncbi:MAG: flap endonuclease-1 [Candidatus Aenigmarchaeota archaeon ex4484_224]|nr:MAG: flap endonuclease-1 [Candidatus Aenigmarchaeota archaeon ex4484_224]